MGPGTLNYEIIPSEAGHIRAIAEIEEQCFSMPLTIYQLNSLLPGDMHEMLSATDMASGAVLGYLSMTYVLDEGYINNVAVSPAARRSGIGDALVAAMLRRAKDLKLAFVSLEVRAGNEPAISLYKKNGFEQVGIRKKYYEKPAEDAIIMTVYF